MYKYLLEQERILIMGLQSGKDLEKLYEYSRTQIAWVCHERLVHLIVTLFFGFLLLISASVTMFLGELLFGILFAILLVVVFFYVVHYYRLENGVQRLYLISNQIYDKIKEGNP